MDAEQKLAVDSEFCCAVLVGRTDSFLADVDAPIPEEAQRLLHAAGCEYFGVIAWKDGKVESQPADYHPDTVAKMIEALPMFVQFAAKKLAAKRLEGAGVEWLKKLHSLPDTRG